MQVMDLGCNEVGDEAATALGQSLKHNTGLQCLGLSCNMVHDDGVSHLAEGLMSNSSLLEIDLSMNNVGDGGAYSIADLLRKNTTLESLKVSPKYLGVAGHGVGRDGVVAIGVSKTERGSPVLMHALIALNCGEEELRLIALS